MNQNLKHRLVIGHVGSGKMNSRGENEEKYKKRHRVITIGLWFILAGILLSPLASAHAAPCLSYAYTESGNHKFLIGNNSSNFGDNITIIHNCENVSITLDGEFFAYLTVDATIPIPPGLHQINMTYDNKTVHYQNVMFYPDYLNWEANYDFNMNLPEIEYVEKSLLESSTNWAVFFGIGITWILCVYVYWNLINSFTQRNFIQEVVQ